MSCARPRCPQAQPHRSSSFRYLPCCLSSSFSEQYGVQRNRGQLSPLELARRMRTNGITVYARAAYNDEVVQRRFFGRTSLLLNAPEAIRRVLVDKHENYRRTNATLRVLSPLVGAGLLLSEGRDWRFQRRTLAPA